MGCSCIKTSVKDTILIDVDTNKFRRDSIITKNSNNNKELIVLKNMERIDYDDGKKGTRVKTESTFNLNIRIGNFHIN